MSVEKVLWRQINSQNVTSGSGVYAWYYEHMIGEKDIKDLIASIEMTSTKRKKIVILEEFLKEEVFHYYKEQPYFAQITGSLKPKYSGYLEQDSAVSTGLISKILTNPNALFSLREHLKSISSNFLSPLYIGMSKNVLSRVQQHKVLIEKYKESGVPKVAHDVDCNEIEDHNFAARVVSRNFIQTQMYLVYEEIEIEYSMHNIFENILNRINFPVLGRK